jgi:hypothetical protein
VPEIRIWQTRTTKYCVFAECWGGQIPASARKRLQRTVLHDSAEDDSGISDEVDDDGRVYKNPRNLPSALCPRDEEQATLLVSIG